MLDDSHKYLLKQYIEYEISEILEEDNTFSIEFLKLIIDNESFLEMKISLETYDLGYIIIGLNDIYNHPNLKEKLNLTSRNSITQDEIKKEIRFIINQQIKKKEDDLVHENKMNELKMKLEKMANFILDKASDSNEIDRFFISIFNDPKEDNSSCQKPKDKNLILKNPGSKLNFESNLLTPYYNKKNSWVNRIKKIDTNNRIGNAL